MYYYANVNTLLLSRCEVDDMVFALLQMAEEAQNYLNYTVYE
jgi:hypothetical protein